METVIGDVLVRANLAFHAGRLGEALTLLGEAAVIAPSDAPVRHDLGLVLLKLGRIDEAAKAFREALAADPRFALASLRLGTVLQARGEEGEALASYQRAATLEPTLAQAWFRAGVLLEALGRIDEAVDAFRRGSSPDTAIGQLARARVLLAERRHQDAQAELRALLALYPGHLEATALLGTLLADSGELEEARQCYERVTTSLHYAGCFYDLVRCRPVTQADAGLLARMRAAVEVRGSHPETRLKVHLALGKAADDVGDHREAMRQFDAADTLRTALGRFDPAAFEARVERLIASYPRERPAGVTQAGPAPILIVGLPRSGTTLVEQILSCHPDVTGAGELPFWTERGATWVQAGDAGMKPAFSGQAGLDYARVLHRIGGGRVTDKMPLNILWAGLINESLPRATIVHVRRSPLDTAVSIHRTYFNPRVAFPTGGTALVSAIRAVERLGAHWRTVLPRERFVELDYERLVSEPERVIRGLLATCGLSWDDACLRPERNGRIVQTPSKWQVRQPISAASVGAWRRYQPWLGVLAELSD